MNRNFNKVSKFIGTRLWDTGTPVEVHFCLCFVISIRAVQIY